MNLQEFINKETEGYKSVVELGCMNGQRLNNVSNTVKTKIGIDIYAKYKKNIPEGVQFIEADMMDYKDNVSKKDREVVMFIDSLEHLPKKDAEKLVRSLKQTFKKIIVFAPLGETPQPDDHPSWEGNTTYQKHLSTWTAEDFDKLNFQYDVVKNYHAHISADAIFAIWESKK